MCWAGGQGRWTGSYCFLTDPSSSLKAGRLPPLLNEQKKVEWSASHCCLGSQPDEQCLPFLPGVLTLGTWTLPPSSFPDNAPLSSPVPPVSSFFSSPLLSPPCASCLSPFLFLLLCQVPSPSSHFSFSLYGDLSFLTSLPSPAYSSFSPSLFACPSSLLTSRPVSCHLSPSSKPPGSPFHLPAGP